MLVNNVDNIAIFIVLLVGKTIIANRLSTLVIRRLFTQPSFSLFTQK